MNIVAFAMAVVGTSLSAPSLVDRVFGNGIWILLASAVLAGLGWVIVDYARMLRLRSKMVYP